MARVAVRPTAVSLANRTSRATRAGGTGADYMCATCPLHVSSPLSLLSTVSRLPCFVAISHVSLLLARCFYSRFGTSCSSVVGPRLM